jgi:hypothetical protein
LSSAATVQNWTPCRRRTREVCDFLDTSSENSVSTYNQPNLESTQNQPSFFCLKFWAQSPKLWTQKARLILSWFQVRLIVGWYRIFGTCLEKITNLSRPTAVRCPVLNCCCWAWFFFFVLLSTISRATKLGKNKHFKLLFD